MRINHNVSAMITNGSLFKIGRDMGKSLERLSTGLRINRAGDDAAGLGVSENLRTQVRGTAQAMKNAQDGIAALNIGEGAANEIVEILQRMRELAIQTSNDTLTSKERAYANAEYSQLIDEIDRIANVTNYNGMKIINNDGTATTNTRFGLGGYDAGSSVLWVDAGTAVSVDSITIGIDSLDAASMGVGQGATTLTDQTNSAAAIALLNTAIDSVNTMRANVGSYVNRLEHAINNLTISNSNQQAAETLIRDVDFAAETTQFTRNQILTQSATAMLAQANSIPQSVLQLLGG